MKKKISLLLIILSIFFIPMITNAASGKLSVGDIEMECVYDNGKSLSIYYANEAYSISITNFKLANATTLPYSTSLSFFYDEEATAKDILQNVSCPSRIQSSLYEQESKSGDNTTTLQFEVLFTGGNGSAVMNGATTKYVAGFNPTSGRVVSIEVGSNTALGKRVNWHYVNDATETKDALSFEFKLVSERIYFNNDIQPKRQWAFKSEGQQAASQANYISISEYESQSGITFKVVEKNDFITRISYDDSTKADKYLTNFQTNDVNYVNYICLWPSTKIVASDKNDMAYTFTTPKHYTYSLTRLKVGTQLTSKCDSRYSLYQEVSWEEFEENGTNATSICEVMPQTSLLIATIIYYAGMVVPVLLIVFTAIDISKLVISGNLDEELPKKKKLIIARFIVALCFFFLPLLVQLFVNSNYGIDFGDISCLFTTGEEVPDESATGENPSGEETE